MGAKPKAQTVGFRYFFDIHFTLGKKIDELCALRASGKTAWKGSITTNGQVRINAPKLFGGDKGEGGLDGTLDILFGEEDQGVLPRLAAMLGGLVPAFRGVTTGFYSGLVTSMNPYPKTWEFLVRGGNRLWDGNPWYPEKQFIWLADGQIKAMNPAHILYLVYTGRDFRGLARTRMDEASWRAAADKLYAEGFGLCFEWTRSDTFANFCETVKSHIGAEVYPNRQTGQISIRLLRDDYNVADLPLFDEDSGLLEITQEKTGSTSLAPSQLIVKYIDQIDGAQRQIIVNNNAVAASQGRRSSEEIEFLGVPTGELAGRVGEREMRLKTTGLKRYKGVFDRRARSLNPGQPFRIRSTRRGIPETVVRVGRIEDNFLGDGKITLTVVQDQFNLPATTGVAPPPPGWIPPDRTPRAITVRRLIEAPYRELAGVIDPANLQLLDVSASYLAALAEAPTSLSQSYTLTDRVGSSGAFVDRGTGDWCPTGLLAAELPLAAGPNVVTLTNATRLEDVTVGQAAVVDDEIVRVDAVNYASGTVTLARGCADTVPAKHLAGARVWFYDTFEAVDETVYSQGVTLQARLLTNTSEGQLAPALAATDSLTLTGRQGKPYPPGQFRINGSAYPTKVYGALSVSWAKRDRIGQADQLIDTTVGNIGPEAGATVTLQVYSGTTLKRTYAGLTSSSWSYPLAEDMADGPLQDVRLVLRSVRDGIDSWQQHDITIERHGLGFRLGEELGGVSA
ncbi:TPA: hypothetical protein SLU87_001320 [Pseudomonas aeruginosa]|nr:hypothetical protein [Pseudomonas aeruginosa]